MASMTAAFVRGLCRFVMKHNQALSRKCDFSKKVHFVFDETV